MPNWVNNSINIDGPKDIIEDLWNKSQEDKLLEAMVPIGEWDYGKCVDAWGTKWDVSTDGLEFTDNGDGTATIDGWFESAWAPPTGAMDTFMKENEGVSIVLRYEEPGMDYCGIWDNGDDVECGMSDIVDKLVAGEELHGLEAIMYEEFEGTFDYMVENRMEDE